VTLRVQLLGPPSISWVDEEAGKVFCLADAPDAETAARVHREAHGLVAERIYQVREGD
jgi:hypothetical protein